MGDIENGDVVIIRIGNEESFFVGSEGETIRGRAGAGVGVETGGESFEGAIGLSVEDGDGVAGGVGDEETGAGLVQQHFARVLLGGEAGDDFVGAEVDDGDGGLCPETDIETLAFLVEAAGVGEGIVGAGGGGFVGGGAFGGGEGVEVRRASDGLGEGVGAAEEDVLHRVGAGEVHDGDAVAPDVGDVDALGVGGEREAGGDGAFLGVAKLDGLGVGEAAVGEAEAEE